MQEDRETTASSDKEGTGKVRKAVAAGMEAYLGTEATGASHEEASARALGRAVERYLDSLEGEERVRVLLGLHRPGVRIPEERLLPETPKGKREDLGSRGKAPCRREAAPGPLAQGWPDFLGEGRQGR